MSPTLAAVIIFPSREKKNNIPREAFAMSFVEFFSVLFWAPLANILVIDRLEMTSL